MAAFVDLCRFVPTAGGTTDWTYSSAVGGCQSPAAANAVSGTAYKFLALSSDLTQWEIAEGVYSSAGAGSFARTMVLYNSSGTGTRTPGQSGAGTKVSFSTVPQVAIIGVKEDLISVEEANSFTATQQLRARNNLAVQDAVQAFSTGIGKNIAGRNGSLEVWQRGTSIAVAASATAYTADGWYLSTGASQACTVSRQASASLGVMGRFSAKAARNAGQTGTGAIVFAFPLDEDEVSYLRGNQLLLSCKLLGGANWSPTSGTLTYNVYCGTGAVAKRNGTAYTSETNPVSGTINVAAGGSASLVSAISAAVGTGLTQAEIQFKWIPTGTAGADDSILIDDVQLEAVPAGCVSYAPLFERSSFSYDLYRCQKHYAKSFDYSVAPAQNLASFIGALVGVSATTSAGSVSMRQYWPTQMRASPTLTTYNTSAADANWWDANALTSRTAFTAEISQTSARIVMNATTTAGAQHFIQWTADASI